MMVLLMSTMLVVSRGRPQMSSILMVLIRLIRFTLPTQSTFKMSSFRDKWPPRMR